MFDIFFQAEVAITNKLILFAVSPLSILTQGLSIIIGSVLLVWLLYKSYLIVAGFSTEPLMEFLRDFFIKIFFLTISTAVSYYVDMVYTPISQTSELIGKELGGSNSDSVFSTLEAHFLEIGAVLDSFITDKEPSATAVAEATAKNGGEPVGFFSWAWNSIKDTTAEATDAIGTALNIDNLWKKLLMFINVMIMWVGLLILGVSAFISIITNKLFFMLCLGFGPIFIFMAAFEKTRGYTMSWLSVTLGYGLSYAMIMSIVSIIIQLFKSLFISHGISFPITMSNLIVCAIFSIVIMRAGDITSSFFGSGNISDGTIGAGMLAAKSGFAKFTKGFKGKSDDKSTSKKTTVKKAK